MLNSFTLDAIGRRVFGLISHIDMRDRFFLEVKKQVLVLPQFPEMKPLTVDQITEIKKKLETGL